MNHRKLLIAIHLERDRWAHELITVGKDRDFVTGVMRGLDLAAEETQRLHDRSLRPNTCALPDLKKWNAAVLAKACVTAITYLGVSNYKGAKLVLNRALAKVQIQTTEDHHGARNA